MKKVIMLFAIALLATGCASTSDLEALQGRVDAIEASDKVTANEIEDLKQKMANCENKHKQCIEHCKTVNSKLDNLFKKSQFK